MSDEISLVYITLSQLLDDICLFLRDGVNKEAFSAESQRQAELLIKRSKIQLQHISNITNGECYMQMDEQKKAEEDTEEEEDLIYMDAEEEKEIPVEISDVCPFAGIPAKDLPLDDKVGYIYMKTKFIFGFEKLKRIYAVIHKDWFLVYNNKDSKPCSTYCLRLYKAHMIPTTKHGENATQLFALVHQDTKEKLQFLAQTHKDMLQWITRINRPHQNEERQPNKIEPPQNIEKTPVKETNTEDEEESEEEGELYDAVVLRAETVEKNEVQIEDEEEIYEVISPQSTDKNQHIPAPKPADISTIPTKRQQTPLPPLPVEKNESSESLVSYDNPIAMERWEKKSSISETPSFSEDEEQEIYDVLVTTPAQNGEDRKSSFSPPESPKKEEIGSPLILSLKEKLMQSPSIAKPKEKPMPPKKLSYNSMSSPTKENQPSLRSSMQGSTPTSPNSKSTFQKPILQPKPPFLTKPKIDVKLIKPSVNSKSSTKQVMKLAKQISSK